MTHVINWGGTIATFTQYTTCKICASSHIVISLPFSDILAEGKFKVYRNYKKQKVKTTIEANFRSLMSALFRVNGGCDLIINLLKLRKYNGWHKGKLVDVFTQRCMMLSFLLCKRNFLFVEKFRLSILFSIHVIVTGDPEFNYF